tara:strand:+ start:2913 stop:3338 length:426 start_codon:yes stop_codon:yes gene_type:complete
MENNIRKPDEYFNDVLIGSNRNIETSNEQDDDIEKAISQSLQDYNEDFERQCQEKVIENQIQEILQQEHDEKKLMIETRREMLEPLIIRLLRIDTTKRYTNIIENFINSGNAISKEEYDSLIKFIGKPSLISLINDCILHE